MIWHTTSGIVLYIDFFHVKKLLDCLEANILGLGFKCFSFEEFHGSPSTLNMYLLVTIVQFDILGFVS